MNETDLAPLTALRALIGVLARKGVLERSDVLELRNDVLDGARRLEENPHWDRERNATQALRVFASDFAHDARVSDVE